MQKESVLNLARVYRLYFLKFAKFDLTAAMVVFLVAIPLCLGIALASGVPLFSGLLSGIIGGVVVGILSGSQVSVSGPAAGMVAVVVAALSQLGDFNTFLLALFFAGVIQCIIGFFRAGFVADYVPSNVVQGLVCAIGILLIVKQIPIAFSLSTDLSQFKTQLLETTEGIAYDPAETFAYPINLGAALIACISLSILYFYEYIKQPFLKLIPAPMVVVLVAGILNELFILTHSSLAQGAFNLVNIPQNDGWSDLLSQLNFPKWAAWQNPKVYLYALVIAIVASLESLLNVTAGEKLDKQKRYCSKNQEMTAQGFGNMIAGLIGGIPVTSVVVRTSVNVQAGAKTKMAAIFHGLFLFIAIMLIPSWLNKIPLSALAAVLIYTGYKLTKPSIYKSMYQQGLDRFIPFIITVVSIVAFNLLAGILIGLIGSLFYILKSNSTIRFDIVKEIYPTGMVGRLILPQQISFLNKGSLIAELDSIPKNSQLIIDARYCDYMDKEIVEVIQDFKEEQAPFKGIALNLMGFKNEYKIHNYIDFINVTTYNVQTALTAEEVLILLKEGNQRFLQDSRIHRYSKLDIQLTAKNQHPMAVVLGCIDSRVPVETIFDMSFGDLFCVRVAGTVINDDVLASMEYGCHVMGARLILVLSHTRCGAIQAACNGVKQGYITQLLEKIRPAIEAEVETKTNRNGDNTEFVRHVTTLNGYNSLEQIYQSSEILRQMIDTGKIGLVFATYDVASGQVDFGNGQVTSLTNTQKLLQEKMQHLLDAAKLSI